jgi:ribose/xylose/arabinose/galactoside ABC-type transport system permease subunit
VASAGTEAAAPKPGALARLGVLRRVSLGRYTGVLIGLVVVCVYLALTEPVFLTWGNWQNILRSQAVVFTLAVGMTFVVLTGGIDLSIASATAGAAMILGLSVQHGAPWGLACLAAIGVGLLLGFLNGFVIGVLKIPFFVVTLGTLSIYQSFALLTTSGATISLFSFNSFEPVQQLVNGNTGPFPTVLLIGAAAYLIGAAVLHLTHFGRSVYAVGSNAEAARLTGIKVTLVLVSVYMISGLTAGFGAVVQAGRLTAASPQVDPNLMLTVIAAVLIGGTAFTGGDGGLLGTVIGVLFLGVIQNGLQLSNVSTFWQGTVSGLILICAVGLGVLRSYGWRIRVSRARLRRRRAA